MKGVYIRLDRCLACDSCQLACAVEHSASKTLFGAVFEATSPRWRNFVQTSSGGPVPVVCRHCEDAPCIDACISGAMHREANGSVTNVGLEQRCVGCWMCVMACPYGVITPQHELRLAVKCDLCVDRETPICVEACPTGARIYAEPEEIARVKRQQVAGTVLNP